VASEFRVEVSGITDLMFNAYRGNADTPPQDMLYLKDGIVGLPSANIQSFLALAGDAAIQFKRIPAKKKDVLVVAPSVIIITPPFIPVLREGEQVKFSSFDDNSALYLDTRKTGGSMGGGNMKIPPQMKVRPVLKMPWTMEFNVRLLDNEIGITGDELKWWFEAGGVYTGFGNGRKIGFGKFEVAKWELVKKVKA